MAEGTNAAFGGRSECEKNQLNFTIGKKEHRLALQKEAMITEGIDVEGALFSHRM